MSTSPQDEATPTELSPQLGAQFSLSLAARRLSALRWAALLGGEYDPEAYDVAVEEYRRARAGLAAARDPLLPSAPRFARAA